MRPPRRPAAISDPSGQPMWPLTGLAAPSFDAARRPVLGIKIDNAPDARPQDGLDAADVVIEEQVEGGAVRFLALYQSREAGSVGPIRSVRPVDPLVAAPFGGLFAYSGGTKRFVNMLRQAPVLDLGQETSDRNSTAYRRSGARKAPYNLYSSTTALRSLAPTGWRGPEQSFTFLADGQAWPAAAARPAGELRLRISRITSVAFSWDRVSRSWQRFTNGTPHRVRSASGRVVVARAENVVVQYTPYRDSSAQDRGRNPVPEAAVIGSGRAQFFVDGRVAEGSWAKSSAADPFAYADTAGNPVRFARGATWIVLAPADSEASIR